MPRVLSNGHDHYYQLTGEGTTLVFIHGSFGDMRMWEPQWEYFSSKYRILRYDLRGHGKTGPSDLDRYSMEMYADDLAAMLDELEIDSAVICGLSWGGGIAQTFAVRYPHRLKGLVLVGSTVSMSVTLGEKILRYVLVPKTIMLLMIRILDVKRFVRFSFWLSGLTLGKDWLNKDDRTLEYIQQSMLEIDRNEYLKIWGAIYGFDLQPIETIHSPTLVLTGERDTKMVIRHTAEIMHRVPNAEVCVLPAAYHALTMEQPHAFNKVLEDFLIRIT